MTTFKINQHLTVKCEYYETRYSWGHKAWLYRDNAEIGYKKRTYYNRTWERYTFESILKSLAENKNLNKKEIKLFKEKIANDWREEDEKESNQQFKNIAMVAQLGDIFGQSQKESNDWKIRMIKAGLGDRGLIIPDDWDSLSEAEKENRLNAVINNLK